ncbi:hypothetical protein B0H14DRAFT_2601921 [Mycena olivaceomarginata]|nr:hypothetical protein B0H14DRAFT_2601921 [Mycena olivaceomarginata]
MHESKIDTRVAHSRDQNISENYETLKSCSKSRRLVPVVVVFTQYDVLFYSVFRRLPPSEDRELCKESTQIPMYECQARSTSGFLQSYYLSHHQKRKGRELQTDERQSWISRARERGVMEALEARMELFERMWQSVGVLIFPRCQMKRCFWKAERDAARASASRASRVSLVDSVFCEPEDVQDNVFGVALYLISDLQKHQEIYHSSQEQVRNCPCIVPLSHQRVFVEKLVQVELQTHCANSNPLGIRIATTNQVSSTALLPLVEKLFT